MAIGRTFQQAFAKAMRSRELDSDAAARRPDDEELLDAPRAPGADRYDVAARGLPRAARGVDEVHARTKIDLWFLRELQALARRPRGARSPASARYKAVDTCAAEFAARDAVLLLGLGAPPRPPRGRAAATGRAS